MSDYTHVNLHEVEDQAPKFGLSPDLEFRMARVPLDMENAGVSYIRLAPNFRIPFGHNHKQQEEVYVVVGGSGRAKLEDEIVEVRMWDVVRVAPQVLRAFEAGPEGMELICIGGKRPKGGDSEQFRDFWVD